MTTDRELERDTRMFETSSQKVVRLLFLAVPIPRLKTALEGKIKGLLMPMSGPC